MSTGSCSLSSRGSVQDSDKNQSENGGRVVKSHSKIKSCIHCTVISIYYLLSKNTSEPQSDLTSLYLNHKVEFGYSFGDLYLFPGLS